MREARRAGDAKHVVLFHSGCLVLGHQCWGDGWEVLALLLGPP